MKPNFYLLLFLIVLCLFGCKEEEKNLTLSEEKLIPLLYDLQVAEAALKGIHHQDKDSMANIYYKEIYERNQVSEKELIENLKILKESPKMTNKIYKEVVEFHKVKEKERKAGGKPK